MRAVLEVVFEGYERRITALEREVAELKEQARKTSQNSSKPPSSDGPHVKRKPPKAPSGRKLGRQSGHPLHRRALVPLEQVDVVVKCQPTHCRRCNQPLAGAEGEPVRHQVLELSPLKPHVTEYQIHRLYCPGCGITTCGQLPAGVPAQGYGPRFTSLIALCSGAYRLSKRQIVSFCRDVLRIPLATGEVCKLEQRVKHALRPAVQQARAYIQTQHTNIDETPWRERVRRRWLWAAVTEQVSVFQIAPGRGGPSLLPRTSSSLAVCEHPAPVNGYLSSTTLVVQPPENRPETHRQSIGRIIVPARRWRGIAVQPGEYWQPKLMTDLAHSFRTKAVSAQTRNTAILLFDTPDDIEHLATLPRVEVKDYGLAVEHNAFHALRLEMEKLRKFRMAAESPVQGTPGAALLTPLDANPDIFERCIL